MRITWFKPYKNLVHVVEIYTNIHLVFYWRLYCGYLWVNQVVINEPRRGQNLPYARDQFLPIWRSVLKARFITRVYPSYIPKKELPYILDDRNREQPNNRRSSQIRVGLLGLLERSFPKVASNRKLASTHQSRRLFSAASTALKMLKHAWWLSKKGNIFTSRSFFWP
jgi:hypothetical protein